MTVQFVANGGDELVLATEPATMLIERSLFSSFGKQKFLKYFKESLE